MNKPFLYEIRAGNDRSIPVNAWATDVPGLIITPEEGTGPGYTVTHERSGYAVTRNAIPHLEAARMFATEIAGLTDWSQSPDAFRSEHTGMLELHEEIERRYAAFMERLERNPREVLFSGVDKVAEDNLLDIP